MLYEQVYPKRAAPGVSAARKQMLAWALASPAMVPDPPNSNRGMLLALFEESAAVSTPVFSAAGTPKHVDAMNKAHLPTEALKLVSAESVLHANANMTQGLSASVNASSDARLPASKVDLYRDGPLLDAHAKVNLSKSEQEVPTGASAGGALDALHESASLAWNGWMWNVHSHPRPSHNGTSRLMTATRLFDKDSRAARAMDEAAQKAAAAAAGRPFKRQLRAEDVFSPVCID